MITEAQQRALDARDDARALALWVSIANRIVPAFVRAARLRFLPRAGSHVEAELWFGPLVQVRGADSIVLYPDVAAALRAELGAERAALAKAELERVFPNRRRLVQLEEELASNALLPNGAGDAAVERTLRSIMRTIVDERSRAGLARWAAALRARIPEIARFPSALQLEIVAKLSLQGPAATIDPGTFDTISAEDQALLRMAVPGAVDVGIRADTSSITITQPPAEDDDVVTVSASDPNVLFLRSGSENGATSQMLALVKDAPAPTGPLTASAVLAGGFPATLTTVTGQRYSVTSLSAATVSARATAASYLVEILDVSEPSSGTVRIIGRGTQVSPDIVVTSSRIIDGPANVPAQRRAPVLLAVRFPGDPKSQVLATLLPRETSPPPARHGLVGLQLQRGMPARPDVTMPALEAGATVLLPGSGRTISDVSWLAFAATPTSDGYSVLSASRNTSAGLDAYLGAPAIHADGKHIGGVCIDADGELRCVTWRSVASFVEDVARQRRADGLDATPSSIPAWERTVFVAIPLGRKTVGDRVVDFDHVYRTILVPAITAVRTRDGEALTALRADDTLYSGSIDGEMYRVLELSRLVIADITGSNPNVLFELGMRFKARPSGTLVIRQEGSGVPFDLSNVRVTVYDPDQPATAAAQITKLVAAALGALTLESPLRAYLTEQDSDGSIAASLSQAENATAQGDFAEALVSIERVLQRVDDPELHVRCAALANRIERFDVAIQHANAALQLNPGYAAAYRERGIAEARNGVDADAEKSLERAVELDRTDADSWASLGGVYLRLGRILEAIDSYERASDLTDDPNVIITTLRLKASVGPVRLDDRDRSRLAAVERFRLAQAQASPPIDTPWCFFDLSDIAYFDRRMEDFRRNLELAVSLATPTQVAAHLNYLTTAEKYADDDDIGEAVRYLRSANPA